MERKQGKGTERRISNCGKPAFLFGRREDMGHHRIPREVLLDYTAELRLLIPLLLGPD